MTKAKTIEDKCTNWFLVRIDRREEREKGADNKIEYFEIKRCLKCKGYDESCPSYSASKKFAEELYYRVNKSSFERRKNQS